MLLLASLATASNDRAPKRTFKNPLHVMATLYQEWAAKHDLEPLVDSSSSGVGSPCGDGTGSGSCVNTDTNNCGNGVLEAGLCPGGNNVECCLTNWGSCAGGTCVTTSQCSANGGTSTPGECPGPDNVQCCSTGGPGPSSSWNRTAAYQVAMTWIKYGIKYSTTPNTLQWVTYGQGPYRSDCSGFVSAAWDETDAGGGPTTFDFPCYAIDSSQLTLGDALLNPSEHVAMFVGWDSNQNPIVVEECGHTSGCCGGQATCPGACGSSSNSCDEACPGCPIQLHSWDGIYAGFYPCRRNGW